MIINIQPENKKKSFVITIEADSTVDKLKQKIEMLSNIPVDEQILFLSHQELKEGELIHYVIPTLSSKYFIENRHKTDFQSQKEEYIKQSKNHEITINLIRRREPLQVFIESSDQKRVVEMEVWPYEPIKVIKQKLESLWQYKVTEQSLQFGGKLLDDSKTFLDYDIQTGQKIYFSLKPSQMRFQSDQGYAVLLMEVNTNTDLNDNDKMRKAKPDEILIIQKKKPKL